MNKSVFVILVIVMFSGIQFHVFASTKTTDYTPDFAYPKTVATNAKTALTTALKADDEISAIRAIMDYALAETSIGEENLSSGIELVKSTREKLKSPDAKSLTALLLADIYSDILNSDRYKYNNRELPLTPLSSDVLEWSGDQFRNEIQSLCSKALSYTPELQQKQLSNYKSIIDYDEASLVYYPTLFDFIAHKAIALLSESGNTSYCMGIISLAPRSTFTTNTPITPGSNQAQMVLEIYSNLLKFHQNDPAPEIFCDLKRLNFASSNLFSSLYEIANKTMYERLLELYNSYSYSKYSGIILPELYNFYRRSNSISSKDMCQILSSFISKHPDYDQIECVTGLRNELLAQSINISVPEMASPEKSVTITVNSVNATEIKLKIFNITSLGNATERVMPSALTSLKPIKELSVPFNFGLPFNESKNIEITLPAYGIYTITASSSKTPKKPDYSLPIIRCTQLSVGSIQNSADSINPYETFVINPLTGAPVEDASIMFKKKNNDTERVIGKSSEYGFYSFPSNVSNGYYRPEKENDRYAPTKHFSIYTDTDNNWQTYTCIFTDLALYHPGDTMQWCAVIYDTKQFSHRFCENKHLSATLYDANHTPVDTINVISDSWGRISGSFKIPTNILTGRYGLMIKSGKETIGSKFFTVSDYKLPTYKINLNKPTFGTPQQGDVTVSGQISTYSGAPLSHIEVKASFSASAGLWRLRSNPTDFYFTTDSTDASGKFSIVVNKEVIANSPFTKGLFTATISATSLSGETQEAFCHFSIGDAYYITSKLGNQLEVTKPINLKDSVIVRNSMGDDISTPIAYELSDLKSGQLVASGFTNTAADWHKIQGGQYSLKFFTTELSADTLTISPIIIYRNSDNYSPVSAPIWSPETEITLSDGNESDALVFAAEENTYALVILSNNNKVLEKRWEKLHKGHNKIKITIPSDVNEAKLSIGATKNYVNANCSFAVKRLSMPSLHLYIESFRDKLLPGSTETWTLRTMNQDSTSVSAALIADMYNEALDALQEPTWNLRFITPSWRPRIFFASTDGSRSAQYTQSLHNTYCNSIQPPTFNTYGLEFSPVRNSRLYGASRNGVIKMAAYKSQDNMETAVAEDSPKASLNKSSSDFVYRENSSPLALFRPMLSTDSTGKQSLSFTVPNQNTSWNLNILGFDREFNTAKIFNQITAAKPLMVQPNLPRFLRCGDKAILVASVINNSDSDYIATVNIELLAPTNMMILGSKVLNLDIASNSTKTVEISVDAPTNMPFIGYRIKASTDEFADGEQSLIPILPSSSPVIETETFFIEPDSLSFSMRIPDYPSNSKITLHYCDNPTWYVATALTGISSQETRTAPQAAAAIFSAAVADGILETMPAVSAALKEWTEGNKSDSTLMSMLQRNSNLKTFLLQATPWMLDAQSDTERMTRLALLFNKENIHSLYQQNIELLKKLQCNSGGWAWMNSYKTESEWATYRTLYILGKLNKLGFMPDSEELTSMITKALSYQQKLTEKAYAKNPNKNYLSYTLLRDLWHKIKPSSTGKRIIKSCVKKTAANWKKLSLADKATASIILANHGNTTTAAQILKSITEYAKTTPTQGMYWPLLSDIAGGTNSELTLTANILEAYVAITPTDSCIDKIRQWLILQKESRDWGSDISATEVAAAILLSSSTWDSASGGFTIEIGDEKLNTTHVESTIGEFTESITSLSSSGKTLKINRKSNSPAWGAITSQSLAKMTDIKASACDAISIEKRFYRLVGSTWENANTFNVGDRIKIELVLHVNTALDYVAISDERAACFEPVEQLPTPIFADNLLFYRENNDESTNLFISSLPRGTYRLTYEMNVNNAGTFSSGIATIQSQYAPQFTAHSSGKSITVTAQ